MPKFFVNSENINDHTITLDKYGLKVVNMATKDNMFVLHLLRNRNIYLIYVNRYLRGVVL